MTGVTGSCGSRSTCKCNMSRQNDARKSYGTVSSDMHLQFKRNILITSIERLRLLLTSILNRYRDVAIDCSMPNTDDSSTCWKTDSIDGDSSRECHSHRSGSIPASSYTPAMSHQMTLNNLNWLSRQKKLTVRLCQSKRT